MTLLKQEDKDVTLGQLSALSGFSRQIEDTPVKVKHIYRPQVIKLQASESLLAASHRLWEEGQRYGCVEKNGEIVGMFDLLNAVDAVQRSRKPWHPTDSVIPVEDLMERDFWVCSTEADAQDILNSMEATGMRCVPVMDDSLVVGIVTIDDLKDQHLQDFDDHLRPDDGLYH